MPLVQVIVVTYRSQRVIAECLAALRAPPGSLTVVDNGSDDSTVDIAVSRGARVLKLENNRGFATACNAGARSTEVSQDSWYAFVNPDVRVPYEDLEAMALAAPEHAVAVSPFIVNPDGKLIADVARPEPRLFTTAVRYLVSARLDVEGKRALRALERSTLRHHRTVATSGACLLVRASAFTRVGGFPEAYFLNVEDVELCCRLGALGTVVVDRAISAVHEKGSSSGDVDGEAWALESARALALFFKRCRPRWQIIPVTGVLLFGSSIRGVIVRLRGRSEWSTFSSNYGLLACVLAGTVRHTLAGDPDPLPAPVFIRLNG